LQIIWTLLSQTSWQVTFHNFCQYILYTYVCRLKLHIFNLLQIHRSRLTKLLFPVSSNFLTQDMRALQSPKRCFFMLNFWPYSWLYKFMEILLTILVLQIVLPGIIMIYSHSKVQNGFSWMNFSIVQHRWVNCTVCN
jgi:hypothetical protein